MDARKIYEYISLYELVMTIGLLFLGIVSQNVYLLTVVAMLYFRYIPENVSKKLLKGYEINMRPACAKDCNGINKGGCVGGEEGRGGFPSGHSTVASFLFFLYLQEFIVRKAETSKAALILTFFFFILLPYARVKLHCHTVKQVLGGMFLGFILAVAFYQLDTRVFCKNDRYRSDKEKAYGFIRNG
jgi:membrane-associated phospholipid phosphatase